MINFIILQASSAAAASAPQQGGGLTSILMIVAIFAVMYLFMIRPQRKQQKELEKFRSSLQKGDKVITAGGIYGTVCEIQERTVLIKVDGEVKLRVDKSSIVRDTTDIQK